MNAVCPACSIAVVPGYVRCPRCRAELPFGPGVRVPWDDCLRLIDVKDILATVEEVNADDAH